MFEFRLRVMWHQKDSIRVKFRDFHQRIKYWDPGPKRRPEADSLVGVAITFARVGWGAPVLEGPEMGTREATGLLLSQRG